MFASGDDTLINFVIHLQPAKLAQPESGALHLCFTFMVDESLLISLRPPRSKVLTICKTWHFIYLKYCSFTLNKATLHLGHFREIGRHNCWVRRYCSAEQPSACCPCEMVDFIPSWLTATVCKLSLSADNSAAFMVLTASSKSSRVSPRFSTITAKPPAPAPQSDRPTDSGRSLSSSARMCGGSEPAAISTFKSQYLFTGVFHSVSALQAAW
jgi:hypothetical protein